MLFPLVLVYFFKIKPKVQYESLKERIVDFFSQPSLNMYFLIGFFALVSGSSVFFSLSRGGIISFLMSLILISFLLSFKWGNKKKIYFVGMVSIILFLFVGLVGWDPIFDRFDMVTDEIQKGRSKIWADSFIMFKDSPIFGFGLGGFNAVYPAYQRVFPGLLVDHAHNDYIELLTEGGIIGFILVAIFMVYLIFFSFKKWYKRNNRNSYYLFVGAFVGILGILFHSFTDFNLQIGANRLILFFIIGIMVSAAVCNSRHTKDVQLNSMSLKKHKIVGYFLTFSTLFYSSMNLSAYIAKVFTDPFSEVDISKKSEDIINIQKEYLSKATLLDFFNGDYHYYLGSANAVLRDNENAVKAYKRSIRFSPYNGENLQYIALALENGKEIDITNKFLSNALKLDISNKSVYQNYTSWLFARGFADKGSDVVKNYLSLFPTNTPEMITLMVIYGFDKNFIIKSMPEDVFSYLSLGDYLMNFGENDLAEVYYTKSLELNKTAQIQLRTPYYKLYGIYNNKKQYENALFLMQEAVNNFPDDPYLRSYLGLMYEKNGIIYKAIEEYRIALMINPKISWVKNRLNNLIPIN